VGLRDCGLETGVRKCAAIVVAVLAAWPVATVTVAQTRTVASVWYRGMPAGVPRQVDLDTIGAAGFSAVTWPLLHVTGAPELRRMADKAGLQVVIRTEPVPLTVESALSENTHVDFLVPRTPVPLYPALMWRAVAHGARVVSFDAGLAEGTGLLNESGRTPSWVAPVSAVARQLVLNATMVDTLTKGPAVKIDPQTPALDVKLLDARRSWVLIATNVSASDAPPADTYVFLPRRVPPAEWLNLFDGSTISMLRRPTDVRWHVVLGPGDVRIYVINKTEGLGLDLHQAAPSLARTASTTFGADGNMPRAAQAPPSTTVSPSITTLNCPYGPPTSSTSALSSRRNRAATRTACNLVTQYAQERT
jgi:hypothetical protein